MKEKFYCSWCGKQLENIEDGFSVKDSLWNSVTNNLKGGIICTKCFEKRLGRDIRFEDLKTSKSGGAVPINFWIIKKEAKSRKDILEEIISCLSKCEVNNSYVMLERDKLISYIKSLEE